MIVVDASVAAKWYLPEAGSPAAMELQEGPDQLFAPDLIRMEVAASITRRVRADRKEERLSPEEALSRCGKWFVLLDQGTLSLIPERELLQQAVKLSVEIKHTLQDCMYLAAAQVLNASLVTADRPFRERASRFYKGVSLLPGCEKN
jgi:predicted nucleic acid-binding protein